MELAWLHALAGGALIGLGAAALLLANGRIAGISGIIRGVVSAPIDRLWIERAVFLLGLVIGAVFVLGPDQTQNINTPWPPVFMAAVIAAVGASLGAGCTSGHGVCGVSRFSIRSIIATATFMASAVAAVAALRLGGLL